MQVPKEAKKKEGTDLDLEKFMESGDNTHNKYTSRTALSAIKTLARNHKTSPHAHAEITSQMIKNGILPKDQAKAREFKILLDATATRNQDQWDYVPCYNHVTGVVENIQVRMGEVLQYMIAAIQDQSKFKRSTYTERLKKFFDLIRMMPEGECNTGRRHDLIVKMLHDDYEDIFIITECKSSIKTLASRFYERKWIEIFKNNPETGYKLLCEWIDGSVLCSLKETPLLDEFFSDGDELQKHLVTFFEGRGFVVKFNASSDESGQELEEDKEDKEDKEAGRELASYIIANVNARANLQFACPDEYKNDIGILVKVWAQKNKVSVDIKKRLADCRRLEDVREQGLDVYVQCTSLRTKSLSNLQILPLGEEEGKLVCCAREVYQRTCQFLEKPQDWASLRQELELLDEQLSKAIDLAAMQSYSELIRDSLSLLNGASNILQFTAMHKKITHCFIKNNLAIQDDQEIMEWISQYVETEAENHIVTLTPYTFNRVCWQAFTTSPAIWSKNFIRLLEMVVIPLIEIAVDKDDDTMDENNKTFFKHSCHKDLETQLRWLLWLAKNPQPNPEEKGHLIFPRLFVPCNLSGLKFENFPSLEALGQQLTQSTPRGGRWPVLTDIMDIDRLQFQNDDSDIKILAHLLLRCPEADFFKILKKGWKFVTNAKNLFAILRVIELSDRHTVLNMGKNLIRHIQELASILTLFLPVDRKDLIKEYLRLITSIQILAHVQRLIPLPDRFDMALSCKHLSRDFDSVFQVAETISSPGALQLIKLHSHFICRFDQLLRVVEKYSQLPECAVIVLEHIHLVTEDGGMVTLLKLLPENVRIGLVDAYLNTPRNHKAFTAILKLLQESERVILLEKHERLFSKFEDLIDIHQLVPKNNFTTLTDKYAVLIKYIGQLVQTLPLISEDKRVALVEKYYQLTKSRGGLDLVLPLLKEEDRVPLVENYFYTIENGYGLFVVLKNGGVPLSCRRTILEKGWSLIQADDSIFPLLLTTLPEFDAEALLEQRLALIKDGTNLAVATSAFNPERRQYWINKAWHLVSTGLHVAHLAAYFRDRGRDELVDKGWHLVKDGFQVVDVALRYDINERRALFDRGWDLIVNESQFSCVMSAADQTDYATLLAKGKHLITADKDFEEFMKYFILSHAVSGSHGLLIEESMKYLKYCNNPLNVVKKLLRQWAQFESTRRFIKQPNDSSDQFAMLPDPEASRDLMEPGFQFIQNFDQLKDVVKDCDEKLRLWVVQKCRSLLSSATQLNEILLLLQENDREVLIAMSAGLIEEETGEDISLMFIQDSELAMLEDKSSPHFSRDSPLNTRRYKSTTPQPLSSSSDVDVAKAWAPK